MRAVQLVEHDQRLPVAEREAVDMALREARSAGRSLVVQTTTTRPMERPAELRSLVERDYNEAVFSVHPPEAKISPANGPALRLPPETCRRSSVTVWSVLDDVGGGTAPGERDNRVVGPTGKVVVTLHWLFAVHDHDGEERLVFDGNLTSLDRWPAAAQKLLSSNLTDGAESPQAE